MNRRQLVQASAVLGLVGTVPGPQAAAQTSSPMPSPQPVAPEDEPVDTRARELTDRLNRLPALTVLEALVTSEVNEPLLQAASNGGSPHALPWNDPADTDLDHALGGALIATNNASLNSPDLDVLGAFIVFESAEIAYAELLRRMENLTNTNSMTTAGTKVWIVHEDDMQIGVNRLANILLIANLAASGNVAEGLILHLDSITRPMA